MDFYVYIPDEAKSDEPDDKVQVSQWFYKLEDVIQKETDLVEICTDKAVYIVTAPVSGRLKEILVQEGEYFSPTNPMCIIDTDLY
ncbi:MAG TPA: biotin attachment protein [Candidatus Hydrogenedens sp.]|nr:biotin attachment protein [Candidatus Hydrogenedens sp.]HOK10023.1 biotin attachment protein [Candidatus Hydrogenedens sp.]HOL19985.1 biotin attachment protein [Candidatus Hydrogenedens sp.]HPP59611.1 biotin attachment protein [Candidatus Hydrogenedens sp.]